MPAATQSSTMIPQVMQLNQVSLGVFEYNSSRREQELQRCYCESAHTQDLHFKSGSIFTVSEPHLS